ncbi:MAG: ABC transporter ATP-binding protein [Acidimicrobiales bacterium]
MTRPPMNEQPLLSIDDLEIRYGTVAAVRSVSLTVPTGQVVALLGPNGAGKTSVLSSIMGLIQPSAGAITFDGHSLLGLKPETIARRGIALVAEGRNIFGDLTVEENLRLGMVARRSPEGRSQDLEQTLDLFPIVKQFLQRQAGLLSGGQQQQLAIARAMVSDPRLLLLDEPSLGLAPAIIDTVFESLDAIRSQGRTILLVEQRATRAAAFADRSHVIANGTIRLSIDRTDTENIDSTDDRIAKAYFGA